MMTTETILIVDDNALLRGSLAKVLGLWRRDAVIAEASDGREALEKARRLQPQLVLMDIRMPVCDGIEATRLITEELPDTKVIMLTVSEDEEDLFSAICNGAHGYLLKDVDPDELLSRLDGALAGEAVIAAPLAQRILDVFVEQARRTAKIGQGGEELSRREQEVLELVSQGATNKEIAEKLVISVGTVKNHIHSILSKLHLNNRAQIAVYAQMRRVAGWH